MRGVRQRVELGVGVLVLAAVCLFWYRYSSWQWSRFRTGGEGAVVARVGAGRITIREFVQEMERRGGAHVRELDKGVLLDEMIEREALFQRAVRSGLDRDRDVVRGWENLLIGKLRERALEPQLRDLSVSEEEAREHYAQHLEQFTTPAKRKLAVVYIETHAKMGNEQRARCRSRMDEARARAVALGPESAAKGFGALAVDYSEDQATRYKGGSIGWIEEGRERSRWDPAVVSAGVALRELGDVSEVVTTDGGLFLIRLMDVRAAAVAPFSDVREKIRHQLLLAKRKQAEETFLEQARGSVRVQVFRDALERISIPGDAGAAEVAPPTVP